MEFRAIATPIPTAPPVVSAWPLLNPKVRDASTPTTVAEIVMCWSVSCPLSPDDRCTSPFFVVTTLSWMTALDTPMMLLTE